MRILKKLLFLKQRIMFSIQHSQEKYYENLSANDASFNNIQFLGKILKPNGTEFVGGMEEQLMIQQQT